MRPEGLLDLVRRQPFMPLRIHTTDGKTYDVRHPDQIVVLRSQAIIGVGGRNGIPQRADYVSLLHVVRVERESEAPSDTA